MVKLSEKDKKTILTLVSEYQKALELQGYCSDELFDKLCINSDILADKYKVDRDAFWCFFFNYDDFPKSLN